MAYRPIFLERDAVVDVRLPRVGGAGVRRLLPRVHVRARWLPRVQAVYGGPSDWVSSARPARSMLAMP